MPVTITVGSQALSDGSEVWHVYVESGNDCLILPAYTESDARELASDIAHTIERHACTDVRTRFGSA